jgi:hypothetical protein
MQGTILKTLNDFIGELPEKQKEVISKRYGLFGDVPMTLEAIGQENGVTRERIRQIEEVALESLRKNIDILSDTVEALKYQLESLGGIRREKKLLEEASHTLFDNYDDLSKNQKEADRLQNNIWFLLDLAPYFNYLLERKNNHSAWYREQEVLKRVDSIHKFVKKELKRNNKPLAVDQYQDLIRRTMKEFGIKNENILLSYLDLSKEFGFNPYYQFGLTEWPLINPVSVNSKAKLILSSVQKPLHFEELTKLINEAGFDNEKQARSTTVHNELIKDPEFILIGRGLYALSDWGYEPGTVKDVLVKIMKKTGPKAYRELLEEMKKHRIVKDATILINLQDKKLFKKLPDGRYALTK